jgi:hypothetical protein
MAGKSRAYVLVFGLALVAPGLAGFCVFGWYALSDWHALQRAYVEFEIAAHRSDDIRSVLVAEARQNIHRVNLAVEGVWALLCAIVAAIGIHGLFWRR